MASGPPQICRLFATRRVRVRPVLRAGEMVYPVAARTPHQLEMVVEPLRNGLMCTLLSQPDCTHGNHNIIILVGTTFVHHTSLVAPPENYRKLQKLPVAKPLLSCISPMTLLLGLWVLSKTGSFLASPETLHLRGLQHAAKNFQYFGRFMI